MVDALKTVTVFGSGRPRESDPAYEEARQLGRELARAGFRVCNGGYGGSMEASARGAKEAGGTTIGITTKAFGCGANRWIDEEICLDTHLDRLGKLIELGDAYIVLKGGTGTLVELATVWEYRNKGLIREKPILVLGESWGPVIDSFSEMLAWEGLGDSARYVRLVDGVEECVRMISDEVKVQKEDRSQK